MRYLLLVILVLAASPARADLRSFFDPSTPSSDAIVAGVQSCIRSSEKQDWGGVRPSLNLLVKYCACSMDFMIAKGGVTMPVMYRCADHAKKHAGNPKPVKSPYQGKNKLSCEQVFWAVVRCEDTKEARQLPTRNKQVFCACLADAMRVVGLKPDKEAASMCAAFLTAKL